MNLSDIAQVVAKSAPFLGAALEGPGGAAIGALIAKEFGGDYKDPGQLANLISGDPDHDTKLLALQNAHAEFIITNQLATQKLAVDDRVSARQAAVEEEKTGDFTARNLAYMLTIGFYICVITVFFPAVDINAQERELLMYLFGVLSTCFSCVINFYFGSSNN